ncbi:MAG: phosphate ABC transporter permease subunit PstC [Hyphomonadaceae bacterium]|nr:phosphate ABC transporter permease subunit PstC [Hyphomonadaceae bacterium]
MLETFSQIPMAWLAFAALAAAGCAAFLAGRTIAMGIARTSEAQLNSQPNYHGYYVAMWTVTPAALLLLGHALFGSGLTRSLLMAELPDGFASFDRLQLAQYLDRVSEAATLDRSVWAGEPLFAAVTERYMILKGGLKLGTFLLAILAGLAGLAFATRRLQASFRARHEVERGIQLALFACAAIAVATTAGIVVSLLFESIRFFSQVPLFDFLFGLHWNAQTEEHFGAIPLFFGTFIISLIAMCVAVPVGLYAAIYLSEYAGARARAWIKPMLEILAGIPTVVYGFFALLVIAPAVRTSAVWLNGLPFIPDEFFAASSTNALAAGLVMGVMIIPFVSSLSDDVINAVPQSLRDGAFAMGATRSETVKQVVMPAALPGVIASVLLAVSRAIGETMIVVMAAGLRPQITADPTAEITTITVQIVALLTGDSEFDSPKTLSAFALGFVLFALTLVFNLVALRVVQKYREKYD